MTDWRALCAELTNELQGYASANPHHDSDALVARARAALAAEPQGEGLSDQELRDAYWDAYREASMCSAEQAWLSGLRAVARWGRPAPPPADGEVARFAEWLQGHGEQAVELGRPDWAHMLTRAADLLARQALQPVPVAEEPWLREGWRDKQGQCWMGAPGGGGFLPSWRLCRPEDAPNMSVTLPAHALPLPTDHD